MIFSGDIIIKNIIYHAELTILRALLRLELEDSTIANNSHTISVFGAEVEKTSTDMIKLVVELQDTKRTFLLIIPNPKLCNIWFQHFVLASNSNPSTYKRIMTRNKTRAQLKLLVRGNSNKFQMIVPESPVTNGTLTPNQALSKENKTIISFDNNPEQIGVEITKDSESKESGTKSTTEEEADKKSCQSQSR